MADNTLLSNKKIDIGPCVWDLRCQGKHTHRERKQQTYNIPTLLRREIKGTLLYNNISDQQSRYVINVLKLKITELKLQLYR